MATIEHGHEHLLIVWDDLLRPDGKRAVWAKCVCGLEERRWFEGDPQRIYKVEVRVGGIWMDPLDLLRTVPIRLDECENCHGDPDPLKPTCPVCHGVGVLEDGAEVKLIVPTPQEPPTPSETTSA